MEEDEREAKATVQCCSDEITVDKKQSKSNGYKHAAPYLFSVPEAQSFPEGRLFALMKYSLAPSSRRGSNRGAVFLPGRLPPTVRPVGSGGGAGRPARRPVQSHPAAVVGRWRAELLHPGPGVPAERLGSLVSPPISLPQPFVFVCFGGQALHLLCAEFEPCV